MKHVTWLSSNGIEESFKSLKMTGVFLVQTEEDKFLWKWMLVALHNSLQGFMACALKGDDGLSAMKDFVARKWLEAKETGQPLPNEQLDTFLNLYKKIKSERMLVNSNSRSFTATPRQDYCMRKLNRLRNHFVHFTPKSWSLEVNDLPGISRECIQVLRFLVLKSGNIETREKQKEEISNEINIILNQLAKLEAIYKM